MADSLREQMLNAGFKEKKPERKPKKPAKPHAAANNKRDAEAEKQRVQAQAALQRKSIKAKIRALIEATKIDKHTGDIAHGYMLGTRIRQLHLNKEVRDRIIAGELVITRLNGATFVIPADTGEQVLVLNPDWIVIKTADTDDTVDEAYADHQVPDDLQW